MQKRTKIIIGAIVAFVVIGAIGSGGDEESTVEAAETTTTTTEAPTTTTEATTTTVPETTTTVSACDAAIADGLNAIEDWFDELDATEADEDARRDAIDSFDGEGIGYALGLGCGESRVGEGVSAWIVYVHEQGKNEDRGHLSRITAISMTGPLCDSEFDLTPEAQAVCDAETDYPEMTEIEDETEPEMSRSQENAIRSARSYLDYTAFSREGLIDQLEYEGYSIDEATFAVDYLDVDWNEQAWKSAESYLDFTSFSRSGLIDQLMYEGFTREQATYGVDKAGL